MMSQVSLGNMFTERDSLWFRREGEKVRNSRSKEERGETKGCSAPVRRGMKDRREGRRKWKIQQVVVRKQRYVTGWWGVEVEKDKNSFEKTCSPPNVLTNCGGVSSTEWGVGGQRGGTLSTGKRSRWRRAGVGWFGWTEQPSLSKGVQIKQILTLLYLSVEGNTNTESCSPVRFWFVLGLEKAALSLTAGH